MIIMHNMEATNTNRVLGSNLNKQSKVLEKLSSGCKINRAGDNAAGLSISEKMRAQIRGLNQASNNMQDGVSLIQTAEGALNEVHNMVQRIREISVQAANGTNTEEDKNAIQEEIKQLIEEVNNVSKTTEFNGTKLLDGSLKGELKGIGDTKGEYDEVKNILKTQIVPRAVKGIIDNYGSAFSYLKDSTLGIGLELYSDAKSSTLAAVGCSAYPKEGGAYYTLKVNMAKVGIDKSGEITEDGRRKLETTIVHEMIHGFMDEALTNGMLGYSDGKRDSNNEYPLWFIEGMAQTAAGGYSNDNDWVNGNGTGLNIQSGTTTSEISSILKNSSKSLASNTNSGNYGTGYLACMYLGHLASGKTEITTENLSKGVSSVLKKLEDGNSLNSVIKEVSGGKYTSVSDFESKFGDSDSSEFVAKLTKEVGDTGNGGLASGNIKDNDLLPNEEYDTNLFALNTGKKGVINIYPKDATVLEGGGSIKDGDATNTGTGKPTQQDEPDDTPKPEEVATFGGGLTLQVGANNGQIMNIEIDSVSSTNLGIDSIVVTSKDEAEESLKKCDEAIKKVSTIRSNLGAYQNRLEHAMSNVDNAAENTQAAESRVRDADMASEMMHYSKFNVLVQAAQSLLAQSNQSKQSVLKLLQ